MASVIVLIDGEHHPPAVRDALERIEHTRAIAGLVFCGGEEKLSEPPSEQLLRTSGPRRAPRAGAAGAGA